MLQKSTVYFIAGLGADKKAFSFLNLHFCNPVFIDWIKPLKNESLSSYAMRLRESITGTNPVIVGVSFGGMLLSEMAKKDPDLRGIIISSNKTAKEFPAYLRIWKYMPVYKWVPGRFIKLTGRLMKRYVGPRGTEQRKVYLNILRDTDAAFTAWAVDAILHWNNQTVPSNITHIHGSADRLLKIRYVNPHHIIEKGKHFMIMDNAAELSDLLQKIITGLAGT